MPTLVQAETPGDERGALLHFLEAQRGGIRRALLGLTAEQAVARPSKSELTLAGLAKHCAEVEQGWVLMAQGLSPAVERDESNWDGSHRLEGEETVESVLAHWQDVARDTERFVRELPDLDATFPLPEAPWFPPNSERSMRWLLLHLIEEIARHAGHADVVRESLDGKTAFVLVEEAGEM
ncbi:DinB family protein [Streptomyces sp. URMC 123]|uniref:DinB family protein n=1 Tax=Streptomyces sp. URMC 123 TaxID=3423403 RepID=UPI003F1986A5